MFIISRGSVLRYARRRSTHPISVEKGGRLAGSTKDMVASGLCVGAAGKMGDAASRHLRRRLATLWRDSAPEVRSQSLSSSEAFFERELVHFVFHRVLGTAAGCHATLSRAETRSASGTTCGGEYSTSIRVFLLDCVFFGAFFLCACPGVFTWQHSSLL